MKDHAGDPLADAFGDVDISKKTNVVEYEDAAPLSCKITLNAKRGRFLTSGPIIQKWDRIFVRVTTRNGNTKESVFHVKTIKKQRLKGKGLQLVLFCPHQSSNRLGVRVSLPNIRISGFEALNDLINQVNDSANRGSSDPEIIIQSPFDKTNKLGNRLDVTLTNNYPQEFVPLQKAVENIITKEGNVLSGGGAFQFHYFRFVSLYNHSTHTDLDKIGIQVFEQGFKNIGGTFSNIPTVTLTKPTLESGDRGQVETLDSNEETELGTNLIAIGEKGSGAIPREYSIFQGEKDAFNLVREWQNAVEYKIGQRVKFNGAKYNALQDHLSNLGVNDPASGLGIFWTGPEAFVPSVEYSPHTKDKAQYWINSLAGAKHADTLSGEHICFVDFNCVIDDPKHNRLFVDVVNNDSVNMITFQATQLMKNGLPYDTFKVLVTDPATGTNAGLAGDFVGNDINGVAFSQNVVEWQIIDDVGQWVVIRETETDDEVVDWFECKAWTFDRCSGILTTGSPKDVCTLGSRNGIWKKGAYGFSNGFLGTGVGAQFRDNALFDCFHLVKRNHSGQVEVGNERINSDDISGTSAVFINFAPKDDPRSAVAGLNFDMLFPKTSNGVPFGVVNIGEQMDNPLFDLNNMNKNTKGSESWFGEDVIDFFPIQGWKFWEKIEDFLPFGLLNFINPGNYNMKLWLVDRFFNKITIDYIHGANSVTLPQDAPLGKRKTQVSVQGVTGFIQTKEPENNVVFDIRNVIKGGIVTADAYDSQNKFISGVNETISLGQNNNRFYNSEKVHLAIDAWRMTKPLVATNIRDASKPIRNIMPQLLKEERIVSQNQLQDFVDSEELIFNFQAANYTVDRPARNDLEFGDPVYLNDVEAINETTNGLPNTILAVVDREIITTSKPVKGPGGVTSKVYLKTRLFP